ncbi:hypothetical protein C8R46DRAFT_1225731 [Mycena filopes]|nr:hypothetical protein C8R46DRAFT_1225731 [Mycena filopes]
MSKNDAPPQFPTDIDRETSIRKALKQLNYEDCYHYFSVLAENPRDSDMWVKAFEAKFENKGTFGRDEWDQLLGHCMAVTDTPCNVFAEELLAAYPDAKVVLSVRDDVDVWYASYMNALQPFWDWMYLEPGIMGMVKRNLVRRPREDGMAWRLLRHTYYRDFPRLGKSHYAQHNEKIRRLAKDQGRDFLEFNVKQGWGPLCAFLGKDVPKEEFPRGNDTAEMRGLVRGLKDQYDAGVRRNTLRLLGAVIVVVAALGMGYIRS